MSTADMIKAAKSVLSSSLLPPVVTRRWLKPIQHAADLRSFVGAPWEIRSIQDANGRVTDYYSKGGDVGAYATELVLSPDHGVGFTVMIAGPAPGGINGELRTMLYEQLQEIFMPAVEQAARAEANTAFAGTYADTASNSSVDIGTDDGTGMSLSNFLSDGKPSIEILGARLGIANGVRPRLFPTTLKTVRRGMNGTGEYTSRLGFRSVYVPPKPAATEFGDTCQALYNLNSPMYGNTGLDDWVFELDEGGMATAIVNRGLRLRLAKQ